MSADARRKAGMAGTSKADVGPWLAVSPTDAAAWLAPLTVRWWFAGGWAIDLHAGAQSRPHGDLDVGVLRRDVREVLAKLSSWEVYEAAAGALNRLDLGALPRSGVNSLWCRPAGAAEWRMEILLDDAIDDEWIFRRQPAIRRRLSSLVRHSAQALPYLAPEIQLLYKSRNPRARDEADFRLIAPRLDGAARSWLSDALARTDPAHAWSEDLKSSGN
jgi:hypothetical protein